MNILSSDSIPWPSMLGAIFVWQRFFMAASPPCRPMALWCTTCPCPIGTPPIFVLAVLIAAPFLSHSQAAAN